MTEWGDVRGGEWNNISQEGDGEVPVVVGGCELKQVR